MKTVVTAGTIFKLAEESGYKHGTYDNSPEGQRYKELENKRELDAMFSSILPEGENNLFKSAKYLRNLKIKINWLVEQYFEMESIIMWFAIWGTLKSFLAIDLGLSVALGKKWAGQKTQQGSVFYLAGEGMLGVTRRIEAWCIKNNIPLDTEIPFYVSQQSISFDKPENIDLIINQMIEIHGDPKLVIIDTIASSFGAGDENSTKDMNRFFQNVKRLREKFNLTILLIHHSGHENSNRSRGASCLEAGLDSISQITREKDQMEVCLRRAKKMKDADPPPDTWFKAEVIKVGFDENLTPLTSLALTHMMDYREPINVTNLGVNEQYIFDSIPPDGIDLEKIRSEFKDWKKSEGTSFSRQNYGRALKALKDKGLVYEKEQKLFKNM